jgi:D-psicose/D-tagatose/L-ribulose 3-epimerase
LGAELAGDGLKLAASNIGWDAASDAAVFGMLREHGVSGIEVAPARLWQEPWRATTAEIAVERERLEREGLTVVALQALLFRQPELRLFDDEATRDRLAEYLRLIIEMAAGLGARALVFGSPQNRKVGSLPKAEADRIARRFFRRLGDYAATRNAVLCLEPNPAEYGCDYLNRLDEAVTLVQEIDSPGVRVQLDVSSLILNGEDPDAVIGPAFPWIGHVHASEPHLSGMGQHLAMHARVAAQLRRLGWTGWVSLEMRDPGGDHKLDVLGGAFGAMREVYGEGANAVPSGL